MSDVKKPNRLIIKEMIEAGGCTNKQIETELNISAASRATNFTYLRLMGYYPIADENGILSFVDEETWETIKTEKAEKASSKSTSSKSPQDRYDALVKRIHRCTKAMNSAELKVKTSGDDALLKLRYDKAQIELQIAELERDSLLEQSGNEIDTSVNEVSETSEEVIDVEKVDTDIDFDEFEQVE